MKNGLDGGTNLLEWLNTPGLHQDSRIRNSTSGFHFSDSRGTKLVELSTVNREEELLSYSREHPKVWMSKWRLWAGCGLVVWAVGLQVHLWQMKSTQEFKQVFGDESADEATKISWKMKRSD